MSLLAENGNMIIEGSMSDPDPTNLYGCRNAPTTTTSKEGVTTMTKDSDMERHVDDQLLNEDTNGDDQEEEDADDDETCPNHMIQVVHRGACSFIQKSAMTKRETYADGVIVINSDSEEVFIMSYGSEDEEYLNNPQLLPVSVLVSGMDGSDLMERFSQLQSSIESDPEAMSFVTTRIAIRRQLSQADSSLLTTSEDDDDEEEEGKEMIRFPLVRASPTSLRIYSKGGWGMHAMQQVENPGRAHWHLQLLRHQFDNDVSRKEENGNLNNNDQQEMESDNDDKVEEEEEQEEMVHDLDDDDLD